MSNKPAPVIRHPDRFNSQGESTIEYLLPADELPADVAAGLDPWIRQFQGKSPHEVKAVVTKRWETIQSPALQELRDRLLEFQPISIVVHEGKSWLRLQLPTDVQGIGDSWYLPPPTSTDWSAKLKKAGQHDHAVMVEFLEHFSGLLEDRPGSSGGFLCAEEWHFFPLYPLPLQVDKATEEWQGSLILFHACNSNDLLVHPDGRLGWWYLPEGEVVESYPNLESFLRAFTRFSREYSWAFDGYNAPLKHRRSTE